MVKVCLVETDPEFVYVSVTDTGIGISPEARPLIFERMYQAPDTVDDSRKGLGLGLHIAREIVRQHGGRIWVESDPGNGSTFTFTLPLFSLAKEISPTVTHEDRLRDFFTLIRVELKAATQRAGNWNTVRQRCQEILLRCIMPDKDVLLPPIGSLGTDETFLILASANQRDANTIAKRIVEQLAQNIEMSTSVSATVSTMPIQHPSELDKKPLIKQIQEIADSITEQAMAASRLDHANQAGAAIAGQCGNKE